MKRSQTPPANVSPDIDTTVSTRFGSSFYSRDSIPVSPEADRSFPIMANAAQDPASHLPVTERTPLVITPSSGISGLPVYANGLTKRIEGLTRSAASLNADSILCGPSSATSHILNGTSLPNKNPDMVRSAVSDPRAFSVGFLERTLRDPVEAFLRRILIHLLGLFLKTVNKFLKCLKLPAVDLDVGALEQSGWDFEVYADRHFYAVGGPAQARPLSGDNQPSEPDSRRGGSILFVPLELLILVQKVSINFITMIQEHSLQLAPVVALGHLSSTALAASTVATMIISVTGYSVVRGIVNALDRFLFAADQGYVPISVSLNLPKSLPPDNSVPSDAPLSAFSTTSFDTLVAQPDTPLSGITTVSPSSTITLTPFSSSDDDTDLVPIDAQRWRTARLWCLRAALLTAVVLPPILVLWLNCGPLLAALKQDEDVSKLAIVFLKITALGLPAYTFNAIMGKYLLALGLQRAQTRALTLVTPLNMLLNYLLVTGPESTSLGFIGAPIATAISYNLIAVMTLLFYLLSSWRLQRRAIASIIQPRPLNAASNSDISPITSFPHAPTFLPDHRQESVSDTLTEFFEGMGQITKAAFAGVVKSASECWSKDSTAFVASLLGPTALATQSVILALASTAYQGPLSISSASSARVMKLLGRGDILPARIVTIIGFLFCFGAVIFLSNVLLAFGPSISRLFTSDNRVVDLAITVLPVITVYQVFHGLSAWVDGTLGAFGKQLTLPALIASADYCAGIPLGVYFALVRHWGLPGIWVGFTIGQAYACIVGMGILSRYLSSRSLARMMSRSHGMRDQE